MSNHGKQPSLHHGVPPSQDDSKLPAQGFNPTVGAPAFLTAPLPQGQSEPYVPAYLSASAQISQPSASLGHFPHYADLVGKNPVLHSALFSQTPWFHAAAVRNQALIQPYVVAGRLPDGLQIAAIYTEDWLSHCALPDNAIARRRGESLAQARARFTKLVYQRMRRTLSTVPLDPDWRMDTWAARTNGEAYSYLEHLANLDVRQWRSRTTVSTAALCFEQPQLRAEFRYLRKRDLPYWECPRWERKARSRLGYLVPYQMLETDSARKYARDGRYVPIPANWHTIESPRGCPVELPPVKTYYGSELARDPYSGYWAVVYTECIAKMACYILWDAYDTYRLWYMTPVARALDRSLDLALVLGSAANQADFRHLLDVMDQVNWNRVPNEQRARGSLALSYDHSPGRTSSQGGDFIWYDPWTREHVTSSAAKQLRENPRIMPTTQPTGYLYEPQPVSQDALDDEVMHDQAAVEELDEQEYVDLDNPAGPMAKGPVEDPAEKQQVSEPSPPAVAPALQDVAKEQPPTAEPGSAPNSSDEDNLSSVREFLIEAGLPPTLVHGRNRADLLQLLRHHMNLSPYS